MCRKTQIKVALLQKEKQTNKKKPTTFFLLKSSFLKTNYNVYMSQYYAYEFGVG